MISGSLLAATVFGCSVIGGYTPEELVREADQIVLARVVGAERPPPAQGLKGGDRRKRELAIDTVRFEVVEVLKGARCVSLTVAGQLDRYDGPSSGPVPYTEVRPGGRRGACYAYDYREGGTFLLLLKKGTPYWAPLHPTNEEVTGVADPWVAWVRRQLSP